MKWEIEKMSDGSKIYKSGVFRINSIGNGKSYVLVTVEPIKLSSRIGHLAYLTNSLKDAKSEAECYV